VKKMTDAKLRQWWEGVHSAYAEILYRHDPLHMGSSVGAPDDEYFDEATRTIRTALDLSEDGGLRQALESRWPGSDPAMLDELVSAWRPPPSEAES